MKKLILIDGNAIVHRAFHALPALTSAKGVVTNAVFGFTSIFLKMIRDLEPDYIAATFDLAGPTFRHEQFEDYKIHRVKAPDELYRQIPIVKEILGAFGVPVYEKQGYEADDVIGTLASLAKREKNGKIQVIIVTGDLDTLQLVDGEKVVVYTMRKGMADTVTYDEKAVWTRYSLKPSQLSDYRGLKGDPSDNIPGVSGIGEKTAAELIQKFGSLDNLYEELAKNKISLITSKQISEKLADKLLANKDQAYFSKQLSGIICDLDIDFNLNGFEWRKNLKLSQIEHLFKDLQFFSLLKRLPEIGLTVQPDMFQSSAQPLTSKSTTVVREEKEEKDIFFVENDGIGLTDEIISNPEKLIIGHDLKSSVKSFIRKGLEIKCRFFDTKIAAHLLYPDLKDYDFHKIYFGEFKENADDPTQKKNYLIKLKKKLWEKLESARLSEVFDSIEMPLIRVIAEMELNGVKVNTLGLEKLAQVVGKDLAGLEKKIYKLAGMEFNINSPQQLGEILFEKLAIKGRVRRTGGGALSTAAPELEKLRESHPIIDLILEYRELQKLRTTYIEPLPQFINSQDGRVHTTYNQTGTATGRLSSQDPNLQNIPVKTELGQEFRKSFIAQEGYKLISLDYSQLELRVVAHIANDGKMIETFKNGEDIHTRTAVEIFNVAPYHVTKEMRRQAKVLNFGMIYGMGAPAFARGAGINRDQAGEFIKRYFNEFSGVARYMDEIKNKAHQDGYVETIFGRRRPILDIYSTMPQIKAAAERAAINHPVQGTAADLMKLAMIKVHDFVHKNHTQEEIKLLLQVHDELVIEVKEELVSKITASVREIMEKVHQLKVPLIVDVNFGDNWQDIQPLVAN